MAWYSSCPPRISKKCRVSVLLILHSSVLPFCLRVGMHRLKSFFLVFDVHALKLYSHWNGCRSLPLDGSVSDPPSASALPEPTQADHTPSITTTEGPADDPGPSAPAAEAEEVEWDSSGESDADSTDYFSLEDSDEEEETSDTKEDRAAREAERQRVLEAAGLVVQRDKPPPPRPPRRKRSVKQRRPAPAAPKRASVLSVTSDKDLPTLPTESTAPISRPMRLDDAYERYEEFKSKNRMSMSSMSDVPSSPTSASITPGAVSPAPSIARDDSTRSHSRFLSHILGRSKTPDRIMPVISGPILQTPEVPDRPNSPAFGSVST